MSLSNPQKSTNPAQKFIRWNGGKGHFSYYKKDEKRNIFIEDDIYFIMLDQLATIVGYDEKNESGIYSNEVKNTIENELVVRNFKGHPIATGFYRDIKDKIKVAGGNFASSVYAARILPSKEGGVPNLELVNFQFSGSSLAPFIDIKARDDGSVILLSSKEKTEAKKGATTYYIPKITKLQKRPDILEQAIALDRELQAYLTGKANQTIVEAESQPQTQYFTADEDLPDVDKIMSDITIDMPF